MNVLYDNISCSIQAEKHVACTRAVFNCNSSLIRQICNSKSYVSKEDLIKSFDAKLDSEAL